MLNLSYSWSNFFIFSENFYMCMKTSLCSACMLINGLTVRLVSPNLSREYFAKSFSSSHQIGHKMPLSTRWGKVSICYYRNSYFFSFCWRWNSLSSFLVGLSTYMILTSSSVTTGFSTFSILKFGSSLSATGTNCAKPTSHRTRPPHLRFICSRVLKRFLVFSGDGSSKTTSSASFSSSSYSYSSFSFASSSSSPSSPCPSIFSKTT